VRTSGCAAIGVVTELMDVHATLSIRVITLDVPSDGGRGGFRALLESHMASDLGVTPDDGNCEGSISVTVAIRRVEARGVGSRET
jgi:hypothetical protein